MSTLNPIKLWSQSLPDTEKPMPVLFIGHGSPMNGIEINPFSSKWASLGKEIPLPKAVLVISAHWLTRGTHVTAMPNPKTIHDFGGFPNELYKVQYPAPGLPELAESMQQQVKQTTLGLDYDWGLDHGAWTVIRHMYPQADIPVIQLSIDIHKPATYHYNLAKELSTLRKKGVLILGSGNMVHNLGAIAWNKFNVPNFGFDWAIEANETFKKLISKHEHQKLIQYKELGSFSSLAIPTPDHYLPLIYTLALQNPSDQLDFFNDAYVAGSLTMTSLKIES